MGSRRYQQGNETVLLHKTTVQSIILYNLETRTVRSEDRHNLRVF